MEESEIIEKFANSQNLYYGHGIGASDEDIINSIFKYGLRCSHGELYKTTLEFGHGSRDLFKENEKIMNNWPHKGSKQIIIASLPERFHHLDIIGTPMYQKRHAAFYNKVSSDQAIKLGISPGEYLKPEFVMGVDDSIKSQFTMNDRYYENLPEKAKQELMEQVKDQYVKIINQSGWTISEYNEILQEIGIEIPLSLDEVKQLEKSNEEIITIEKLKQDIVESGISVDETKKAIDNIENEIDKSEEWIEI